MGKKKETQRKKIVNGSRYSEALSDMDFCSKCDPFPCLWKNDSDEEDEFDQDCQLLMEFEYESNDSFMDALEENDIFIEEISQLKICLEEAKLAEENLKKQIIEKEEHNEKLECKIVRLRKEIEKEKSLNIIFAKGSETLYEIIKVQCSPLNLYTVKNIKDCKVFYKNRKLSQCSKKKQSTKL